LLAAAGVLEGVAVAAGFEAAGFAGAFLAAGAEGLDEAVLSTMLIFCMPSGSTALISRKQSVAVRSYVAARLAH